MRTVLYLISLVMLALAMIIATIGSSAKAGGPWSDQYCDISTETIIVKDPQGNIVSKNTKEKTYLVLKLLFGSTTHYALDQK